MLRRYGVKFNLAKYAFGVRSWRFLGYMVTQMGIKLNPTKVRVVQDMEPPKGIKEVQQLTGRITALSRFISRSTEKKFPFFRVLRKDCRFE